VCVLNTSVSSEPLVDESPNSIAKAGCRKSKMFADILLQDQLGRLDSFGVQGRAVSIGLVKERFKGIRRAKCLTIEQFQRGPFLGSVDKSKSRIGRPAERVVVI